MFKAEFKNRIGLAGFLLSLMQPVAMLVGLYCTSIGFEPIGRQCFNASYFVIMPITIVVSALGLQYRPRFLAAVGLTFGICWALAPCIFSPNLH